MSANLSYIDQPVEARAAESPNLDTLREYLLGKIIAPGDHISIKQFPGGYSNLSFLLIAGDKEFVLRKPPLGANIKSAHDMGREYNVLRSLKPVYPSIPEPILFCDNIEVIGSPFYIMERVEGIILRNKLPKGMELTTQTLRQISEAAIDNLVNLHSIDIHSNGLVNLGKPEGYIARQVEGWIKRYQHAETDSIPEMDSTAEWLMSNIPQEQAATFIHNDYKYDNLVLDPENFSHILAVLDWEMATVGDPLMDLGTSLAYWAEATDSDALKPFNLTWLEGNLTREQVLQRYQVKTGLNADQILFYYVFGSYKIAVIVQQIFSRYKKGFTHDSRFASLLYVVKACAENARNAIAYNRISNFY